jgi:PAS domain S-box-containing protein
LAYGILLMILAAAAPALSSAAPLVAVLDDNRPPLSFGGDDGRPAGYYVDVLRALEERTGQPIQAKTMNWHDAQAAVLEKRADFIVALNRTPDRLERFDFTRPILDQKNVLFVREDNFRISRAADCIGYRVSVQKGTVSEEYLRANFPEIRLVPYADLPLALLAMAKGEVDAAAGNYFSGEHWIYRYRDIYHVKATGEPLLTTSACLGVARSRLDLTEALDRGLASLERDGSLARLKDKWFGENYFFSLRTTTMARYLLALSVILLGCLLALIGFKRQVKRVVANKLQTERDLMVSRAHLEHAQDVTGIGNWEYDLASGALSWSKELYRLNQRDPALGPPTLEEMMIMAEPSNGRTMEECIRTALQDGTCFFLDCRRTLPDGSTRFFSATGSPRYDTAGIMTHLIGTVVDITDRRRATEELEWTTAAFTRTQSITRTGIWTYDIEKELVTFSDQLLRIFGLDPGTLPLTLGEVRSRIHPDDRSGFDRNLARTIRSGRYEPFEFRFQRPDVAVGHAISAGIVESTESGKPVRIFGVIQDITERRLAEKILAEREAQYRSLAEHSQDLITRYDRERRILFANPAFLRAASMNEAQVLGKTHRQIGFSAELCALCDQVIDRVFATARPHGETFRWPGAHEAMILDWRLFPELDAHGEIVSVVGVARDITTQQVAQEKTAWLASFPELNPNPIVEVSWPDGKIEYLNPACRALFPTLETDGLEHPLLRVEDQAEGSLRDFGSRSSDVEIEERWYHRVSVRDLDRRHIRVYAFDISERKRAEVERDEMMDRLLQSQKLESLGVMAGGIAHDFNNLLMAILGNLELALIDTTGDAPARLGLEQAIHSTLKAADLTRQMLVYVGLEDRLLSAIDLNALVQENAALLRTAVSRKIDLDLCLTPQPCLVDADQGQLQQVVMNLITNAAEAIGDDVGSIHLATAVTYCDQAVLERSRTDSKPPAGWYASLEVSDAGCGMDETTLQRLFDPFFTTKFTGRGLGMASVLGIVRAHGGAVMVDSHVGKGTTVMVFIPVRPIAADNPAPTFGSRIQLPAAFSPAHMVLVVDDEEPVREITMALLRRLGFQTLGAIDGADAVDVFRTHADGISCVLMDLTMPRMDGLTAGRELREIRPDIPVVLCSGYHEKIASAPGNPGGFAGFLNKPCSLEELHSAVLRAINLPT